MMFRWTVFCAFGIVSILALVGISYMIGETSKKSKFIANYQNKPLDYREQLVKQIKTHGETPVDDASMPDKDKDHGDPGIDMKLAQLKAEKDKILHNKLSLNNDRDAVEKKEKELFQKEDELIAKHVWLQDELDRFQEAQNKFFKVQLDHMTYKTNVTSQNPPIKRQGHAATGSSVNEDLWEGLDPKVIGNKYPGILLDGTYMLRPFIDRGKISLEAFSDANAEERFFRLITTIHMHCGYKERMGNYGDGGWDMCMAGPYHPSSKCLVYSFGINNDFSFDDAISDRYRCQVHSFDPSMDRGDHRHSKRVYFHKLGLGAVNQDNEVGWKLKTLGTILEEFGHADEVIDYLKIDIDYNEWTVFHTLLQEDVLKNVKQLAFEIHTSEVKGFNYPSNKEEFYNWYNMLLGFEKLGFRRYGYHLNPTGRYISLRSNKERSCCYELYYVNINYLKDG